jgi:hypothetical protein
VAIGHTGLASRRAAQQATKLAASLARMWLWAKSRPSVSLIFFLNLSINYRNSSKLSKIIEICRTFKKMQNKFCWTPYE